MGSRTGSWTKRCAIAAMAVGILTGLASPAGAASISREDYPGGESAFKEECRMAGGTFERDRWGRVRCTFDTGWVVVCDRGAKDCRSFDTNSFKGTPTRTYTGPAAFTTR